MKQFRNMKTLIYLIGLQPAGLADALPSFEVSLTPYTATTASVVFCLDPQPTRRALDSRHQKYLTNLLEQLNVQDEGAAWRFAHACGIYIMCPF